MGARPQGSFAIIDDARTRARRRRLVAAGLAATIFAVAAVVVVSRGGGSGPGPSSAQRSSALSGSEAAGINGEVIVDGVTIYTASDGDATFYSFEPFGAGDPARSQESASFMTTGDLKGCELLAKRPGKVVQGCALLIAQVQAGGLTLETGPPKATYSVCGRPPGPGEIAGCNGPVTDRDISKSLRELRQALRNPS